MSRRQGYVVVVDDDPAVRKSLEALLSGTGLNTLSYPSGAALLDAGLPAAPGCVLLDLQLPGESGIEIQQSLLSTDPTLPIIFLSGHADVQSAVSALKAGAVDFLEKGSFSPHELVDRVQSAVQTHRKSREERRRAEIMRNKIARLSRRELEVAQLVAVGNSNKAAAMELGISERTVEIHRGNVMKKLELRSVTDLARLVDELNTAGRDTAP